MKLWSCESRCLFDNDMCESRKPERVTTGWLIERTKRKQSEKEKQPGLRKLQSIWKTSSWNELSQPFSKTKARRRRRRANAKAKAKAWFASCRFCPFFSGVSFAFLHVSDSFLLGLPAGEVLAFGSNECAQLGLGEDEPSKGKPVVIPALAGKRTVKISCGGLHNAAVQQDGSVWTWWFKFSGKLSVFYLSFSIVLTGAAMTT